jgi:hypothetical protein
VTPYKLSHIDGSINKFQELEYPCQFKKGNTRITTSALQASTQLQSTLGYIITQKEKSWIRPSVHASARDYYL